MCWCRGGLFGLILALFGFVLGSVPLRFVDHFTQTPYMQALMISVQC